MWKSSRYFELCNCCLYFAEIELKLIYKYDIVDLKKITSESYVMRLRLASVTF